MNKEIQTTVGKEGFEGILFPADNTKDKVLIVISGSNGGMKLTKECAEFYSRHSVPALALAIFGTKQTEKNLDRIPLEYVEFAIRWLKKLGYRRIGIDGTSKGSELALLCASLFPDISCVIARVPSYFVSEGLVSKGKMKKPSGTSCWSYHGKEIPFARYNYRSFNLPKIILKERELHLISINKEKTIKDEDIISVEKINAPILLISGKNDAVWPSYQSCLYIEKRLKEKGFEYPVKHIAFEYIGHEMLVSLSPLYKLAFRAERKYKTECKEERKRLAYELLNWVRNQWK